jgi:hypothetical protein
MFCRSQASFSKTKVSILRGEIRFGAVTVTRPSSDDTRRLKRLARADSLTFTAIWGGPGMKIVVIYAWFSMKNRIPSILNLNAFDTLALLWQEAQIVDKSKSLKGTSRCPRKNGV